GGVLVVVADLLVGQVGGALDQAVVERLLVGPVGRIGRVALEMGELEGVVGSGLAGGKHVAKAPRVVGPVVRPARARRGRRGERHRRDGGEAGSTRAFWSSDSHPDLAAPIDLLAR